MLPQLNSSNGRTALIFQILLIAQGSSWWRQQQLLTCCFVQVFELVLENEVRNVATKMLDFSYFLFMPEQSVRTSCFFKHRGIAFSAVQFTVPVILGFTSYKTLELRGIKWRICYR
jgi:hypothetical protein